MTLSLILNNSVASHILWLDIQFVLAISLMLRVQKFIFLLRSNFRFTHHALNISNLFLLEPVLVFCFFLLEFLSLWFIFFIHLSHFLFIAFLNLLLLLLIIRVFILLFMLVLLNYQFFLSSALLVSMVRYLLILNVLRLFIQWTDNLYLFLLFRWGLFDWCLVLLLYDLIRWIILLKGLIMLLNLLGKV